MLLALSGNYLHYVRNNLTVRRLVNSKNLGHSNIFLQGVFFLYNSYNGSIPSFRTSFFLINFYNIKHILQLESKKRYIRDRLHCIASAVLSAYQRTFDKISCNFVEWNYSPFATMHSSHSVFISNLLILLTKHPFRFNFFIIVKIQIPN